MLYAAAMSWNAVRKISCVTEAAYGG
jgi:hypothetical protein